MTHDQLHIGIEFWCGGRRWRCTVVGSRVSIAIRLEPQAIVEVERVHDQEVTFQERQYAADDPSWMVGPPYAVVEHVFDEYSIEGCSLLPEGGDSER
jgi:hypothetical protein